jgi:hypothetical protein
MLNRVFCKRNFVTKLYVIAVIRVCIFFAKIFSIVSRIAITSITLKSIILIFLSIFLTN